MMLLLLPRSMLIILILFDEACGNQCADFGLWEVTACFGIFFAKQLLGTKKQTHTFNEKGTLTTSLTLFWAHDEKYPFSLIVYLLKINIVQFSEQWIHMDYLQNSIAPKWNI